MRGLYAICDTETLEKAGISPLAFAEAVLLAGPCALQLRAKDLSCATAVSLLRELAPLARAAGVPLYANDRPDVAVFAGCAGVHLGQTDMAVDVARSIAKGVQIGLSTHDLDQVARAIALHPAYLALGPIFPTQTKLDADPAVGLSLLAAAKRLTSKAGIPLVAIGGITLETAPQVAESADAIAVISDLTRGAQTMGDVTARARAYVELFQRRTTAERVAELGP
jgi:thiamine-phosphate pyrophosphorylase